MEVIPVNPILEYHPDTLNTLRSIYNLGNGRMTQSVDLLYDWVQKQTHFVNKNYSREYLERTLIACKGSVEKAKTQIDRLCTLKTLLPKFFLSTGLQDTLSRLEEYACLVPLPKMTKDYQRIYVSKLNFKELASNSDGLVMDWYRLNTVLCEYLKAHDYVNGFIVVHDFRDANIMDLMTLMNVTDLHQVLTIVMEGYGGRLSNIYMITQSKAIDIMIKMIKMVVSPKIASRFHVVPDLEDLHRSMDVNLLPEDLGGTQRSLKKLQEAWSEILCSEEFEKYLIEMKASCTDESLRQTDKFNEQHIGLPGSFRTLSVD